MSNNPQENHHLSNSRLTSNRRADHPEIEQFTNFTPWEVDEGLEYSPSHYPQKVEEKKKQSRPQTSKALYFPDLVSGIESYTKNPNSPRSSRNLIQKAPENKIRAPENVKNKKRSITSASNANIKSASGGPLNMYKFPVSKKALNPQRGSEAQSMNLDASSTVEDQEQHEIKISESKEQISVNNNRSLSRERIQNNNNNRDQTQISPGKLHRHLQNVFERDRELTGQLLNGARGYTVKPKVLNLSTKGAELKYDGDNSDNFREAMSSLREIAYEHVREESIESETNKENLKSESFVETTEKFRPMNGIPRRSQTGFKSVDITNQKIRHVKTVEEEALTSENTPRGYQVPARKLVGGGAPRTPLANTMLTSQNVKLDQKLFPFNKNRTLRSGSQAKQRVDFSEEQRKNSILGLEIKSNEYVIHTQTSATVSTKRTRVAIPGFVQNNMSQNQERSITINNYIPSMLDCYRKNKRKYLVSPSKLAPQLKDAFHNYYDTTAHTPLVRTLRRINGKCQYDKHILNYFNDTNEPVSTDTDDKVLNHFLNKSHKPKINLPSRKANANTSTSQNDKSDLIDRFINQTMSNMSGTGGGGKIKLNEARNFMTEKSPERMVSWNGQRKLKPAVELQNFIIRK